MKAAIGRLGWVWAYLLGLVFVQAQPRTSKPNIVLILADDLGWSDIGAYGGEIPTPHLDSLAAGGVRFTQFYTNAVCGPTRASLLTGQYAQRVGHSGTHWNHPTNYKISITFGEALQQAGYRTMAVGKWQDPDFPAKKGFDRFYGTMCAGKISYYDEVILNPFYLDTTRVSLPDDFYLTEALSTHAAYFVEEALQKKQTDRKPFLLYLAHIAPHWPLHASEQAIASHRARYRQAGWEHWRQKRLDFQRKEGLIAPTQAAAALPKEIHTWNSEPYKDWQAERMAVYSAQVASVDESLGRIKALLRKQGEWENTLVIFLSDNGPAPDGGLAPSTSLLGFAPDSAINSHWRLDKQPIVPGSGPKNLPGPANTFQAYGLAWALTGSTPFRGTKLTGYEGGIRVPFIAYWPSGIPTQGTIVHEPSHVFDILPSLLEVGKGTYPAVFQDRKPRPLDGKSLVPLWQGKTQKNHSTLAWQVPQHRAFREGNWKIVSQNEQSTWELYDLEKDAIEAHNIAHLHPALVKKLGAKWENWHKGE